MNSSKAKALVIVFVLFLFTSLVTVGCAQKPKTGWVNTDSLPGQTFSKHSRNDTKQNNSTIVYLGSDKHSQSSSNFGPRDVSFDFNDLK